MADKEKDFEERVESESESARRVTNDDMVCRDCINKVDDAVKYGNTSKCLRYGVKPVGVMLGGKCEGYEKV